MSSSLALDILCHYAARNVSPKYTLQIARLALLHRDHHSEPIVSIAKNIVDHLENSSASVICRPHDRLPPSIDTERLLAMLPLLNEWEYCVPQTILDLALHDAIVFEESADVVKTLLENGADPNAIHEAVYFPPLIIAARHGLVEHARALLDAGAHINIRVDGQTPLRHAAWCGHRRMVDMLRTRGGTI